jgi:outer membrane protein
MPGPGRWIRPWHGINSNYKNGNIILSKPSSAFISMLFMLIWATSANAVDLVQIYEQAEASDPLFKQSVAAYNAVREAKPQAWSQLMPVLSLNAYTATNDQDISTAGIGASGKVGFNTHGYSLDISQPVFRFDRFLALEQADSQILQAEAELNAAQQDLIVRVSERYFEVLAAIDNLEFVRAERVSLHRQLEQAKQLFEVGLIAITDVQEAQAGYDRSVANEILAENAIDNAREALREVTGNYQTELTPLGTNMPLVSPQPAIIEEWTQISQEQNMQVRATRHELETARQTIKIQQSGHLPTLDIVASKGYDSGGGRFGGTKVDATAIGLEFSMPLFQGGVVNSRTREARHRYDEALERLEQQFRSAQRQTREAYLGVVSGVSQVKALDQAVTSSQTALLATEAGFEVGTRTAVDLVASQRVLLQAKRDYARARYDYILNTLRLKQAAGTLSPDDLKEINSWLE